MNRIILSALNGPGLVVLALLGVALQSSIFTLEWLTPLQPDLLIFLVIWCALKRNFTEGGVLTLIFGHLAEIQSSAPRGLFLLLYMSLYLLIRLSDRLMMIWRLLPLTMAATAFFKIEMLIAVRILDIGDHYWRHIFLYLLPSVGINALLAKPAYRSLARYDIFTFKDKVAIQAIESGLQPEDEGL